MPGEAPRKNVNIGESDPYPLPENKGVAGTGYNFDDSDVSGAASALARYRQAGLSDLPSVDAKKFSEDADKDPASATTSPRIRDPWVITCQSWLEFPARYIVCNINPASIQWNLPIRASEQKTKQGVVLHTWRDRSRGTYFDEPSVTINFQSGNIMPVRIIGGKAVIPEGVKNFTEFLELVDEPLQLPDGRANTRYISLSTVLLPTLTLAGNWDPQGIQWAENVENPNIIDAWTATFKIYGSFPPLKGPALLEMYRQAGSRRIEGAARGSSTGTLGASTPSQVPSAPVTRGAPGTVSV